MIINCLAEADNGDLLVTAGWDAVLHFWVIYSLAHGNLYVWVVSGVVRPNVTFTTVIGRILAKGKLRGLHSIFHSTLKVI